MKPPFKILQVTPTYAPSIGGIEDVVRSLAKSLSEAGCDCDVAEVNTSIRREASDKVDASTVFRVPFHGHRLVGVAPGLRDLVRRYDLLHVHDPQLTSLSLNVAIWARQKPLVLSTHGGFFHTARNAWGKKLHARSSARAILSLYSSVLASSESDYSRFTQLSKRVELAANGVNIDRFLNTPRSDSVGFMDWIFWGRFSRNKRIDCVIAYAAAARKRGFDVRLTICGSECDHSAESLKDLASEHGIREHLTIIEAPPDPLLMECIAGSSVFITASEYEGFGLSVIEAMASGLPVICRNISPLKHFVAPGLNGVLLAFDGSAEDLAKLEMFLSHTDADYSCISHINRRSAEQYSWKFALEPFQRVYQRLLLKNVQ